MAQAGDEGSGTDYPVLAATFEYDINAIRSALPANARIQVARFNIAQRIQGNPYSIGPLESQIVVSLRDGGTVPGISVAARNSAAVSLDVTDALRLALNPANPAELFQPVFGFDLTNRTRRSNNDTTADIVTIIPGRLVVVYTLS